MSRSSGTGWPLWFFCARCRKRPGWREGRHPRRGSRWVLTGRRRRLYGRQASNGNARALSYAVEYRCLDCGHTGWTRMKDAERRAVKPEDAAGGEI